MAAKMINTGQAEYLDMGWAYEELIPFLKEVFVGSEGMSTSAWERLILYARFNLDRIVSIPSTVKREAYTLGAPQLVHGRCIVYGHRVVCA